MNHSQILEYSVQEAVPYINWIYFFHAWGFPPRFAAAAHLHDCDGCRAAWKASFEEEEQPKATEALTLYQEAMQMLRLLNREVKVRTLFRLCRAVSDGDDLLIEEVRLPLLRQQRVQAEGIPHLCLSDFIRPASQGIPDQIGLFASSTDVAAETLHRDDPYQHLLVQTLSDRLAEAATEKMHAYVRRTVWGYAPDEQLSIPDLLQEKFQGIRPAVGYPSLPDQSVNFILDELLHFSRIGITLTEHGAMHPHASVSGLMMAHPLARYFAVGRIDDEQLGDYARRRGLPVEQMRIFLAGNL